MKNVWLGAVSLVVFGGLAMPAQAQTPCAGDCDGSETVAINELITCVNISLGNTPLSSCTACDPDGGGTVAINELIQAVSRSLFGCSGTPLPTRTATPVGTQAICGNNVVEAGEECDDGNNFGGDGPTFGEPGCAANCTMERFPFLRGTFDEEETTAIVQNIGARIQVNLSGGQTFRAGKRRDEIVYGPGNVELFQPGEIPVVIKASELNFAPVQVATVACACVRAIPAPDLFGPGNAAAGVIGCGAQGLTDINYRVIQDHNTNPGNANNACGPPDAAPDDAECNDERFFPVPGNPTSEGTSSLACSELGTDERCNEVGRNLHGGICNSPRIITRFGGQADPGSVFIVNNTSISLLLDGAACSTTGAMPCPAQFVNAGYGPDCKACTDDDEDILAPNTLPATSGTAEAAVYDVNNAENAMGPACSGTQRIIDENEGATGCLGGGCTTRATGQGIDCALLEGENPEDALRGGSLVVAFPAIDAALIKDTVTTTKFVNQ
jgi:cysteine-rich repeat protein